MKLEQKNKEFTISERINGVVAKKQFLNGFRYIYGNMSERESLTISRGDHGCSVRDIRDC